MTDSTRITIRTNPKFRPARAAYVFSLQVILIGVGVVVDSPAMQWMGFVMVALLAIIVAVMSAGKDTALSIDEARALLDEFDRNERKT